MRLNGPVTDVHPTQRLATSDLVARLRSDLRTADFTVDALQELWGESAAAALHRGQRAPAERALAARRAALGPTAVATLAELFVLGRPVARAEAAEALPALGIDAAVALGLVRPAERAGDDRIEPAVDLRPYSFTDALGEAEWWIVSDLGELALGHALPVDHVLGVGGASLTLSGLMLQRPVARALDVGTGCGIQALHASRHADHVVATDISERALELAELNAGLNAIDSIEFRLGSLFEPVAGETFDHIVSNPPFVITPRVEGVPEYEYRDGGMVGDALIEAFVRDAGPHLAPGGVAQLLANWEYRGHEDAFDRVRGWVAASTVPLEFWVIEREVEDAPRYAETWIRDGGTRPATDDFDRLYTAWLDDFVARGVSAVGFGYVLLRRPAEGEPGLQRFERMLGALGSAEAGLGVQLSESLTAYDRQRGLTDDEFSAQRLVVAGDVTEERHYWPGDDAPTAMLLRQGGGFGRAFQAGTAVAALVGACDGELTVGSIVAALAELLEVDEGDLAAELLPAVRELVVDGLLALSE